MGRSPVRHGSDAGEEQVLALVREHAGDLLRLARRFSICVEDAQDAYQRTLEKLVRRMRGEPPEDALKWARTVLRHEALAIRGEREQMLGRLAIEHDRHRDEDSLDPADRVERFERLAHTAEALRGLKPQEMTALALRAEGLSYKEICSRTGWSYTRCNRAVSEGRRSLLQRLRAIESGAECARWLPLLSLLADGEATSRELAELRPHLRSCTACRATLRGFYAAPQQVAALLPAAGLPALGAAASVSGGGFSLGRHLEALAQSFAERANTTVLRFHSVIDTLPGTKLAAVAASTVAVAGGGAAIEQAATAGSSAGGSDAIAATGTPSPVAATPISAATTGAGAAPSDPTPAAGTTAGAVFASSPAAAASPGAASAPATGPLAEFALEPFAAASPAGTPASSATAAAGTAVFQGTSGAGAAVFPATSPADAPASPADAPTPSAATAEDADGSPDGADGARDGAGEAPASRPRRPSAARPAAGPPATHHTAPAATADPPPAKRPEFTPSASPPPPPPPPATPVFSSPRPAAPNGAEFTTP